MNTSGFWQGSNPVVEELTIPSDPLFCDRVKGQRTILLQGVWALGLAVLALAVPNAAGQDGANPRPPYRFYLDGELLDAEEVALGPLEDLDTMSWRKRAPAGGITLRNGDLLDAAQAAGFDAVLATDRNLRYQQNLSRRKVATITLGNGRWRLVKKRLLEIVVVPT